MEIERISPSQYHLKRVLSNELRPKLELDAVTLPQEIVEKCMRFGRKWSAKSADCYQHRGQSNNDTTKEQHIEGKVGEWVACLILRQFGYSCTDPDMNVYEVHERNFEPDLFLEPLPLPNGSKPNGRFKLSVKSCAVQRTPSWGLSWVFQEEDYGIFGHNGNNADLRAKVVVLTHVYKFTGRILFAVSLGDLHKHNLFSPMMIERLQDNKVAVYYKDLRRLGYSCDTFRREIQRALFRSLHVQSIKPVSVSGCKV